MNGMISKFSLNSGKVIVVGPDIHSKDGKLIPVAVNEGDTVLLPEYGGTEVKLDNKESNEKRPASLGTALQQHWPLVRIKLMSFLSSSAVHGPFFNPTLSQH
ncbi:unnamed protein product, partial [Sphenostylis stenocarpa]